MLFGIGFATMMDDQYLQQFAIPPWGTRVFEVCCLVNSMLNICFMEVTQCSWELYNIGMNSNASMTTDIESIHVGIQAHDDVQLSISQGLREVSRGKPKLAH